MSTRYIGHIYGYAIHVRRVRLIVTVMIILTLMGCGKTEPTATLTPSPEPLASTAVKTFGGPDSDIAYGILLTSDGGALIAGMADNVQPHGHSGDPKGHARLIKTDPEGNTIWEKDYGQGVYAAFFSMIQTSQGDYVLLGDASAPDGSGNTDVYLVKVDEEGNEIWSYTYGDSGTQLGRAVQQTADSGYILIGSTSSSPGTYASIYLVKTDAQGKEMWSQAYGDQFLHLGWGVTQMPDGGYVFTGFSAPDHDARDFLAMKINAAGDVQWSRTWDFGGLDEGLALTPTSDGDVVILGVASLGSPTSNIVLIKVDSQGNELWKETIDEVGASSWNITAMPDGGYILGGRVGSSALMLKTDAQGQVVWQHTFSAEEYANAFVGPVALLPDGGYIFVGGVTPHGENSPDMLWLKLSSQVADLQ
jgi:hypothetical protein